MNQQEQIAQGSLKSSHRNTHAIILKKALEKDATAIVLSHNHPSGNLRPSKADEDVTLRIKEAAGVFDITVIDHIIVSEEGYYSFADDGKM